jgi:phosphoribosylformylglycinamidine synthase
VVTVAVRALVLTGFGINCDAETKVAFERAGASADRIHLNDLIEAPTRMRDYHILAIPGGFSFGDDVASGKILANRLRYKLGDALREFVAAGKLAIGICNGFQVMVKMGLLPAMEELFRQEVTLTHNESGRFEDRWVYLLPNPLSPCVWTRGMSMFELPVRHGEGRFLARDAGVLKALQDSNLIALQYGTADGAVADGAYPANPNASVDDIAGICDASGRIFGLMPHPEAYTERMHHPRATRENLPDEGIGLRIFRNAVEYAQTQFA